MADSKEYIIRFFADRWETVHELIRCKDCVKSQYDFMTKGYWCDGKQVSENHYCAWAERKNND